MKKTTWIIAIVLVMAIAAGLYYFQPWKKKEAPPADDGTKSKDTNTTTTNTNTGGGGGKVQTEVAIAKANSATILQLQKELNIARDYLAKNAPHLTGGMYAAVKEDGKYGSQTRQAINWAYVLGERVNNGSVGAPLSDQAIGELNLRHIRFLASTIIEKVKIGA